MNKTCCAVGLAAMLLLGGCTPSLLQADLSGSAYRSEASRGWQKKPIAALKVINNASDGKMQYGLIEDTAVPLKLATPTRVTVENDVRDFFAESAAIDGASNINLVITIARADSYWISTGVSKIPIIGLAAVAADTEFGMNLRILFEVEEAGKVRASYLFDEKVTINDQAMTRETIALAYQKLVAEYRKRLFSELEGRFVQRYL